MILLIACAVAACFSFVLLFGAPYLPTLSPQVDTALRLAALKPGQHLLELGCGDGKVLIAAAKRGIRSTGYELNPIIFVVAWLRTRRYRRLVTVRCANFWNATWPPSDVIFVFLLPKFMVRLDTKITQFAAGKPIRLVSFAFKIPEKTIAIEQDGVMLYVY